MDRSLWIRNKQRSLPTGTKTTTSPSKAPRPDQPKKIYVGIDWASQPDTSNTYNTFSYISDAPNAQPRPSIQNISTTIDTLTGAVIESREVRTPNAYGSFTVTREERIGGGPWRITRIEETAALIDSRPPRRAAVSQADRRTVEQRLVDTVLEAEDFSDDRSGLGSWSRNTNDRWGEWFESIEPNEEDKTEEELTVTGRIDITPEPTMNPTMTQGSDPWVWEFVKKKTKNIFEFIKLNSNKAIKSIKPRKIFSWFYK